MSVYVDKMRPKLGRLVMCQMLADTSEELHRMADAIGVQRKWCQFAGTPREHYDICLSKRARAVELGAVEVKRMAVGFIINRKRDLLAAAKRDASRASNVVPSHHSKGVPAPGSSREGEACRDAASPCDIVCKRLKINNFRSSFAAGAEGI